MTVSLTTVEFSPAEGGTGSGGGTGPGGGTRLVLTEQGAFLDGREQPAWREQGTADQLEALAKELTSAQPERAPGSRQTRPGFA